MIVALRHVGLLLLSAVLLAGCASSRSVAPGESRSIFGEYRVQSTAKWSRSGWRNVEIWTVDGPQLQQLRFYEELDEGDSLFEIPKQNVLIPPSVQERWPKFREDMSPHEVMELVTSTLVQWGAVHARGSQLKPARFGGRDGFRFEIEFLAQGGLDYQGLVLGHISHENELYLILYLGARDHYFPKFQQEVESILASIAWR